MPLASVNNKATTRMVTSSCWYHAVYFQSISMEWLICNFHKYQCIFLIVKCLLYLKLSWKKRLGAQAHTAKHTAETFWNMNISISDQYWCRYWRPGTPSESFKTARTMQIWGSECLSFQKHRDLTLDHAAGIPRQPSVTCCKRDSLLTPDPIPLSLFVLPLPPAVLLAWAW